LEARIAQARNQGLLTAAIMVLFAAGLGLWLGRTVTNPVQDMVSATQRLAAGDYTALVQTRGAREFGTLAESYNRMASRLRETLMSLEARARALATSAQVGRHLSALLDQEHLVKDVVEQVRMAFNYYHAQIYLMDDETGDMILAGGTGRAGKILLENRHRVSKGRGLVGRAAETRRLILVPDTTKDADWLPNPHLPATKSEIAVPIIAGDQILGVLDVQNNVENSLTEQDADLLSSIANQVGIALQNARQYQVSQKVARELGVVADIAVATTAITDVKRLLQEAVDRIKSASGLYHAGIYLFNEAGTTLELAAGAGEIGRQMVAEGRSIPLNQEKSLVALTAHALKGLMVNDVRADPHFLPDPLLPETHSQQTAPMIVGGRVIGVLDVQSGYVNHFTEIDVNIRTTLATQIAVTLQSARAFNQVRRQAEYETQLNLINQKIQSAADVDAVLQITARELGSVLGARRTVAHLGMKDKNNAN
ncbi:MAG TPA: GAF domain-containing protein, partial [Anaerolineales bacterium]|nr:GAF domain-containing protein [Anaerolineales bacterium]